ncbi:MAG: glycosyltransferase [Rhodobacteraceae bacterium]|nr:MAG: glycosyltransferase [Paracoccaceae bacterium]
MKIVYSITYYRPHISGLTNGLYPIAEHMARQGHEVTVICARHDPALAADEVLNGVRVLRVPVTWFVGKGPVMPGFAATCLRAMRGADLVHVVAPQADAALAVLAARMRGAPVVISYICSFGASGLKGWVATQTARLSHLLAGALAQRIVALSEDYAAQSRFCRLFRRKLAFIPVPLPCYPQECPAPRTANPVLRIGFVGRLSPEKSLDLLLDAIPHLEARLARPFCIEIVGPEDPPGTPGRNRLRHRLAAEAAQGRVIAHGRLDQAGLDRFYSGIDVLVLPSNSRLEAYGMVQVEAMLRGTPCVASDRPGMRLPIREAGFGRLFAPGDPAALAEALDMVLCYDPRPDAEDIARVRAHFAPGRIFAAHEALISHLAR